MRNFPGPLSWSGLLRCPAGILAGTLVVLAGFGLGIRVGIERWNASVIFYGMLEIPRKAALLG